MNANEMSLADFLDAHGVTAVFSEQPEQPSTLTGGTLYLATVIAPRGATFATEFSGSQWDRENNLKPTREDLFDCLLSDASFAGPEYDVDELAAELGITRPSEAIRIFAACQTIQAQLLGLLGTEALESALYDIER